MSYCGRCIYYKEGGYCWSRHMVVGYLRAACNRFADTPPTDYLTTSISNTMETRTCKKCGRELPLEEFATFRGKVTHTCKECKSEAMKANAMKARAAKASEAQNRAKSEPEEEIGTRVQNAAEEPKVAEKPGAALTWQDVMAIVDIADELIEATDKRVLLRLGLEGYYTMVLEQYKAIKAEGLI